MSNDKKENLSEASEEELLAIASNKIEAPKEEMGLNDAHRMILDLNIKEGDTKIPSGIVYQRYKKWKTKGKVQAISVFLKDFAKFFVSFRSTHFRYYLLDPTPFDLSEESHKAYAKEKREVYEKNWRQKKETQELIEKYKEEKDSKAISGEASGTKEKL